MLDLDQFIGHTPGPWLTWRDPRRFHTLSSISAGAMQIEVGGNTGVQEQEANTRLVAVAPELLAELKKLRHDYDVLKLGAYASLNEWVNRATKAEAELEAIRKAMLTNAEIRKESGDDFRRGELE